ncbi:MAG: thermonuclease family protein [Pseudomonadota bacterium]
MFEVRYGAIFSTAVRLPDVTRQQFSVKEQKYERKLGSCTMSCALTLALCLSTATVPSYGAALKQDSLLVKLWGVEAPSLAQPGGQEANAFLQRLIKHSEVICIPRTLKQESVSAVCYMDNEDLACAMVSAGHAVDASGGYYRRCMPLAESEELV